MAEIQITKKFIIDALSTTAVSIKIENHAIINGEDVIIGCPSRKAYSNSPTGRETLEAEVGEPYTTAIFAIWGDSATLSDPEPPVIY